MYLRVRTIWPFAGSSSILSTQGMPVSIDTEFVRFASTIPSVAVPAMIAKMPWVVATDCNPTIGDGVTIGAGGAVLGAGGGAGIGTAAPLVCTGGAARSRT